MVLLLVERLIVVVLRFLQLQLQLVLVVDTRVA